MKLSEWDREEIVLMKQVATNWKKTHTHTGICIIGKILRRKSDSLRDWIKLINQYSTKLQGGTNFVCVCAIYYLYYDFFYRIMHFYADSWRNVCWIFVQCCSWCCGCCCYTFQSFCLVWGFSSCFTFLAHDNKRFK